VAVAGDSGDAVSNGKTAGGAGGASWSSCSLKRDGGGAIADGMDGGRRVGGSSGRRDAHRRFTTYVGRHVAVLRTTKKAGSGWVIDGAPTMLFYIFFIFSSWGACR